MIYLTDFDGPIYGLGRALETLGDAAATPEAKEAARAKLTDCAGRIYDYEREYTEQSSDMREYRA